MIHKRSKQLKYVILASDRPIFLALSLNHKDVVRAGMEVESAGQCRIHFDPETNRFIVQSFGESISLRVKSRPEDGNILERAFNEGEY